MFDGKGPQKTQYIQDIVSIGFCHSQLTYIPYVALVQIALHFLKQVRSAEEFEQPVGETGWGVHRCSTDHPGQVDKLYFTADRDGRYYSVFKLFTGLIMAARSDCHPTVKKAMEMAMQ